MCGGFLDGHVGRLLGIRVYLYDGMLVWGSIPRPWDEVFTMVMNELMAFPTEYG
jgi:hypothetical protein